MHDEIGSYPGFSRRDVLGFGAMLGLGACAPSALRSAGSTDFSWTLRPAESAGMSALGLQGVRAAIQKNIDAAKIPGAVTAIVHHNKLVWFEAQGLSDPIAGTPMRTDNIFRMMSSTKVVTAVAVLMLLDEGKLALNDKINRFIPTFVNPRVAVAPPGAKDASQVSFVPASRDITIGDLLTHTSGLNSVGDFLSPGVGSLVNKNEIKPNETLADFIPRLGSAALDFQPGSKWRYSPLDGFNVLGRIVEILSGQSLDVFFQERILSPLEMTDTYFNVPAEKQSRVVKVFGRKGEAWEVRKPLLGEGPFTFLHGTGGLFGTVHDFINFEVMLLSKGTFKGRRVLKPETVALMATNHVGTLFAEWIPPITGGAGFGLGVSVVEDETKSNGRGRGAFGWGGAYGTESWADPTLDVAAALFIQLDPAPPEPRQDFQKALRQAIVA